VVPDGSDNDEETPGERANRELIELLNELRVALPGVQVLFAFLLTVPFTQRFGELGPGDRRVYFAAVVSTAVATVLLIAPTAHHRLRFRSGVKESLLRASNVFAVVGLVLVAFAMTAVTYIVANMLYAGRVPAITAACLAGAFAVVWFVLPFVYRERRTPPHSAES
jgi:predicted neutral ceramidase superfamily lipid hydrolase